MLWLQEITSIIDHRSVNCQTIKHPFGDKSEETERKGGVVSLRGDTFPGAMAWMDDRRGDQSEETLDLI